MSISFPTDLDALTNPVSDDTLDTPSHATQHSNANDAIEALEAKVGTDSSAVTTSHDYKLSGVTSTDKAVSKTGIETLTNKTLTAPSITSPTITSAVLNTGVSGTALASGSTVKTGTSDTTIVTPKSIADAGILTTKSVIIQVLNGVTALSTGNGKAYFTVPSELNGMNLVAVHARVVTAGTTNTTDIQIANVTDSVDMLSTKLTIDSGETGSDTAATAAVIDTTKDDVATNDLIRIDVDQVSSTAPQGLIVRLQFQLP